MTIWDALPNTISRPNLEGDPFWATYLQAQVNVHVAILSQPYLGLVLASKKTIESRFAADRRPPYGRVLDGDVILLKRVGGPICGLAQVRKVWSYRISPGIFASIRRNFGPRLCIEDTALWQRYRRANYATLIQLDHVRHIGPIPFPKRDQRAWITFSRASSQLALPLHDGAAI